VWSNLEQCVCVLCKLRKKYVTKKMKEVCQLDSNPLIQALSSYLTVPNSCLASFFRNIRWSLKEEVLALKRSPKSYTFLWSLFPLPSRQSLQSILNTIHFRMGINAHVFKTLKRTLQTMSDGDKVCCLVFDEMSNRENMHSRQWWAKYYFLWEKVHNDRKELPIFLNTSVLSCSGGFSFRNK